jgi:type VI secretion system protein VasG
MIEVDLKPLLKRLNKFCTRSVEAAAGLCISRTHYEVTVEHALVKMAEDPKADISLILRHFDADPARLLRSLQRSVDELRSGNAGRPVFSPILIEWIQDAWLFSSIELGLAEIRSGALMAALAAHSGRYLTGDHAELSKVRPEELKRQFKDVVAGSSEESVAMSAEPAARRGAAAGAGPAGGPDTALGRFAVNFTASARAGRVDPVFGRDREIRQAIDILARRRKNNPIVVGDAGVGKTAIVEGLALRIVQGDVPDLLKGVEIYGLDMGLLQAGAGVKGEFENRLKSVITEIKESPIPIITFIDEAHTLIGAGGPSGGSDAANLLKPALARGELRTIAATTWMEYKKYFEEDPALARRFQLIKVDEPSPKDAAVMLRGLRAKYEESHKVHIRDDAVEAAAVLSSRYIAGRQLPDKGVDLLDTAAARVKILQSAKPAAMDDLQRRIETLERELAAVERDRAGGIAVEEGKVADLGSRIDASKNELARTEDRWRREKEAVVRVLDLRRRIEEASGFAKPAEAPEGGAPAPAPPAPAAADAAAGDGLKAELDHALAALAEIQGREPFIKLEVDPEVVAAVVGDWTGIPVGKMVRDEAGAVLDLEARLKERIKGQDHAMAALAKAIRASKAGLQDPSKPTGVFLLVGPSGVGKTETGLALADLLYGGERFLVSINMSEYQDREMGVSGLIGAKPGYVGYGKGGALTEAVRQRPYCVVLLDEIEKAAVEVRNLFYQVFDKGDLTDGTGRSIDFKNTLILITSNLALDVIQQMCAASPAPDPDEILGAIRPILSKALQPAWLARTTVIPYLPLRADALREIAAIKLNQIARRLMESHRMRMTLDEKVVDTIAERCTEVETGARNIDHILQGTLLPRISTEILERMASGAMPESVRLGMEASGAFTFAFSGAPAPAGA